MASLRSRLSDLGRRLLGDKRGNVTMIFAGAMLPVLVAVGVSIDFSRMAQEQTRLQHTVDIIALAVARDIEASKSDSQIRSEMDKIFNAEFGNSSLKSHSLDYTITPATAKAKVMATATMDSTMLSLISIDELGIGADAEATYGTDFLEVVLVLDNTGSMKTSNKMTELKTAANAMIDELGKTSAGKQGKVKVSVVPFSTVVNVGVGYDTATWLGPRETETTQTCGWVYNRGWRYVCNNVTTNKVWTGCVGDRVSPYTTSGPSVNLAVPATLYPRYYAPTNGNYNHCQLVSMLPLTASLTTAKTKVNSMVAEGATNVAIGAMWGWNMLTPGASASSSEVSTPLKRIMRYMILLTDGENTESTLGLTTAQIDANTATLCSDIKTAGITIFAIRVIEGNEDLLKACASTPNEHYFDVSNSSTLTSVFKKIVSNITKLRLTS